MPIISADSHAEEPYELFERLPHESTGTVRRESRSARTLRQEGLRPIRRILPPPISVRSNENIASGYGRDRSPCVSPTLGRRSLGRGPRLQDFRIPTMNDWSRRGPWRPLRGFGHRPAARHPGRRPERWRSSGFARSRCPSAFRRCPTTPRLRAVLECARRDGDPGRVSRVHARGESHSRGPGGGELLRRRPHHDFARDRRGDESARHADRFRSAAAPPRAQVCVGRVRHRMARGSSVCWTRFTRNATCGTAPSWISGPASTSGGRDTPPSARRAIATSPESTPHVRSMRLASSTSRTFPHCGRGGLRTAGGVDDLPGSFFSMGGSGTQVSRKTNQMVCATCRHVPRNPNIYRGSTRLPKNSPRGRRVPCWSEEKRQACARDGRDRPRDRRQGFDIGPEPAHHPDIAEALLGRGVPATSPTSGLPTSSSRCAECSRGKAASSRPALRARIPRPDRRSALLLLDGGDAQAGLRHLPARAAEPEHLPGLLPAAEEAALVPQRDLRHRPRARDHLSRGAGGGVVSRVQRLAPGRAGAGVARQDAGDAALPAGK